MQTQISIFNFESTKQVRTAVHEDGGIWFCLPDVANVLEISRSSDLLQVAKPAFVKNETSSKRGALDPSGVHKMYISYDSGKKQVTFINEPNLYRVIFRSNKDEAVKFQNWVFDEVLPTIRKTGKYQLSTLTETQLQKIQQGVKRCEKAGYSHQRVYSELHAKWGVSSYKDVKPADFCNVMYFLDNLAHPLPRVNRFEPATARAVSQVMDYLHGLHAEIRRLGGTSPKLTIDEQALAQAVLTRMIQGKRLMVSLDYATNTLKPHLVDEKSYIIRENQIADIIADPSGISKEQLPEIMKAVLKRTGIEV